MLAILFSAAMPVAKDERHIGDHRKTTADQRGSTRRKSNGASHRNRNRNNGGKDKQNRFRRKSKSKIHSGIISANLLWKASVSDVDGGSNTHSVN